MHRFHSVVFIAVACVLALAPQLKAGEDDLFQIKRTNKIAPERFASQQAHVALEGKECKLLFLGDSNTHFWDNVSFQPIWRHYFGDRHAINFGIGGDTINDIRSRLRDTTWGDCHPAVSIILAGTNDRSDKPEKRATKIKQLIDETFSHFPRTVILLVSIPPCGIDYRNSLTVSYFATNDIIKTYADGRRILYIDLAQTMTWEEGLGYEGLGGDRLHLDELGRLRWAELMEPAIAKVLNAPPREPLPHAALPPYRGDPRAPKILVAGDGSAFTGNFRASLQYQLRDHGYQYHLVGPYSDAKMPADTQTLHFGEFGAALNVLQKTIPPITQKYAPDILLLFAGFGETYYGKSPNTPIGSGVDKIIDDTMARSPSTKVVLCLVTPHSIPETDAKAVEANKQLLDMIQARSNAGKPVLYADCYSPLDASCISQGSLPTKEGTQCIAAAVAPSIEAILNKSTSQRPLAAPANLKATPGESSTQLEWIAVPQATRYNVKRSTRSGGPYAIIATSVTGTRFADTGFRSGTPYYYVVSAADSLGQGKDSAEACIPPRSATSGAQ